MLTEDDRESMLGVSSEGSSLSRRFSKRLSPDSQEFLFRRPAVPRLRQRACPPSRESPSAVDRRRGGPLISVNKLRADEHEPGLSILMAFRGRRDESISSPHVLLDKKGFAVGTTMVAARGGGSASVLVLSLVVALRRAELLMASWCSRLSMELMAQASWSFVDINSRSKSAISSSSCEFCIVSSRLGIYWSVGVRRDGILGFVCIIRSVSAAQVI